MVLSGTIFWIISSILISFFLYSDQTTYFNLCLIIVVIIFFHHVPIQIVKCHSDILQQIIYFHISYLCASQVSVSHSMIPKSFFFTHCVDDCPSHPILHIPHGLLLLFLILLMWLFVKLHNTCQSCISFEFSSSFSQST